MTHALKEPLETLIPRIRAQREGRTYSPPPTPLWGRWPSLVMAALLGILLSLAVDIYQDISGFLSREGTGVPCSVFLVEGADRSLVEQQLLSTEGVRSVRFVTREEALGRAHEDLALTELLKWTSPNPLPESFDIEWKTEALRSGRSTEKIAGWSEFQGVSSVQFDSSRADRLVLLQRIQSKMTFLGSFVFWPCALTLVILAGRAMFRLSGPVHLQRLILGTVCTTAAGAVGTLIAGIWLNSFSGVGAVAGAWWGLVLGLKTVRSPTHS